MNETQIRRRAESLWAFHHANPWYGSLQLVLWQVPLYLLYLYCKSTLVPSIPYNSHTAAQIQPRALAVWEGQASRRTVQASVRRPNETRKRCKLVQSAKGSQKTLMSIGYPASGLSSICTTRCTWLKPRWVRMILRWAVKSSTCSAVKRASLYAIGWSSRSTWAFPLLNALNSRWFKGMLLGSWPFRAKTALARRFGTLTT